MKATIASLLVCALFFTVACTQSDNSSPGAGTSVTPANEPATPIKDDSKPEPKINFPRTLKNKPIFTGGGNTGLRCLKPFMMIDENNTIDLGNYLSLNLDCFETAEFDERNYLTFALEANKVDALNVLLKVPNDKKQLLRFYQMDKRGQSLYAFLKSKAPAYLPLLDLAWNLGMRTETSIDGENLADVTWNLRDGEKTVTLAMDYKTYARYKGTTENDYVVSAAQAAFGSFIQIYFDRYGYPLNKTFEYNRGFYTPLQIASLSMGTKNFSLSLHELYLNRGMFLEGGQLSTPILVQLETIRDRLGTNRDATNIKTIDLFYAQIAAKYPAEWLHMIDSTYGNTSSVGLLFNSILQYKTMNLQDAIAAFIPASPSPKIWALRGPIEKQNGFSALVELLANQNRFPAENQFNSLAKFDIYLQGVELGLYQPKCGLLGTRKWPGLTVAKLDRLLAKGMNPKECLGIDEYLVNSTTPEVVVYLAKISGTLSKSVAKHYHMDARKWPEFLKALQVNGLLGQYANILDTSKGWIEISQMDYSLNALIEFLKPMGLLPKLTTWFQNADLLSQQKYCLLTTRNTLNLSEVTKAYQVLGADPRDCYKDVLLKETTSAFLKLAASDKKLVRELVQTYPQLNQQFCTQATIEDAIAVTEEYGLNPALCWKTHVERITNSSRYGRVSIDVIALTDAYIAKYPNIIDPIKSDLKVVESICRADESYAQPFITLHMYALVETPGVVGTTCFKAMHSIHPTPYLHGWVSGLSEDSLRRLKRNLTLEEINFLFFSSRKQLGYSAAEYDHLSSNMRIGMNMQFLAPAVHRYFESLDDAGTRSHAKRWMALVEADFNEGSAEKKECMTQVEAWGSGSIWVNCGDRTDRWSDYSGLYLDKKNPPKRSFLAKWARPISEVLQSRKASGNLGKALKVAGVVFIHSGIMADYTRGTSGTTDYVNLTKEDFVRAYCEIYPIEKELDDLRKYVSPKFPEAVKKLAKLDLSPEMCAK